LCWKARIVMALGGPVTQIFANAVCAVSLKAPGDGAARAFGGDPKTEALGNPIAGRGRVRALTRRGMRWLGGDDYAQSGIGDSPLSRRTFTDPAAAFPGRTRFSAIHEVAVR
jgi:hypothetical protein